MCKYKRGDVVWILCPYSDGSGIKPRPAIICKSQDLVQSCKYFAIEVSSLKEKHDKQRGILINERHAEFNNLGFREDSFITENRAWLPEHFIKPPPYKEDNPLGICKFIDNICP